MIRRAGSDTARWDRARFAVGQVRPRARKIPRKIAAEVSMSPLITVAIRRALLRYAGIGIGRRVDVLDRVRFVARRTTLSDDCFIGTGCYFDDHDTVELGPRVWMGAYCRVQTATHEIGPSDFRCGDFQAAPITIGTGSWLGAGVTVLPGVTIGEGCVIAAGSVVTTDCQPNGLYAGVPASLKRRLPADGSDAALHPRLGTVLDEPAVRALDPFT